MGECPQFAVAGAPPRSDFAWARRLAAGRYRFIIFSNEIPKSFKDTGEVSYQALERESRWGRALNLLLICNVIEAGGGCLSYADRTDAGQPK